MQHSLNQVVSLAQLGENVLIYTHKAATLMRETKKLELGECVIKENTILFPSGGTLEFRVKV